MAYDGVQTHGPLHTARMANVMYTRSNILFQAVMVIASALVRQENQDAVMKQVRRLQELIYPEDPETQELRDKAMKDVLRREGAKSYKVEVVKLGERGE